MSFLGFLRENARWLAGGFLLTFFSSFGQTFFISVSAGQIRAEYGLSHGQFGGIYMAATLASALTLTQLGRIVDFRSVSWTVLLCAPMLGLAAAIMGLSGSLALLLVSLYLLRLFGQGMLNHISFTAMGKWFAQSRGRAVSISSIGVNFGEAILPVSFVALAAVLGWRNVWLMAALLLVAVATPVLFWLMRVERTPQTRVLADGEVAARDWTRAEALRDPAFWMVLSGTLAPPFIITSIIFHQVFLVELRGWSLAAFAASFVFMSAMTVTFALVSGALVDRFSARRMLPSFLVPLAFSCFAIAFIHAQWGAALFMALAGISYGFSSTLFGALWPELYGTRHLGSIRSLITAVMVFMTALGPGITGVLIDLGISYDAILAAMGIYCLLAAAMMAIVAHRLRHRA